MAAIGVVGLVIQIQVAADLATDPHSAGAKTHWDEMASATLTLALVALVAALRTRGWRLVAWTAGLGRDVFGTARSCCPTRRPARVPSGGRSC
jgi:hypothetical protein